MPDRPRTYQSWAPPAKRVVPDWARDPALWRAAFAVLDGPAPAYDGTFLHRDFHLGNVLWTGARITGVVDWVETSWGPAGLDVAHCATYLALLHGPEAATRFVAAYGAVDREAQRYWDVMDCVGYLPDPTKVATPWREAGRDVSDALARARLEEHLGRVLGALVEEPGLRRAERGVDPVEEAADRLAGVDAGDGLRRTGRPRCAPGARASPRAPGRCRS